MSELMVVLLIAGAAMAVIAALKLIDSYEEDWWVVNWPKEEEDG